MGNTKGHRNGFGSLRKLPSGRWQARYTHPITKRVITAPTTFKLKGDATRWLTNEQVGIERGERRDPALERTEFGPYARQWLDERELGARTRATFASQLKHIVSTFETQPISRITPACIRTWHAALRASNLKPNTVAKIYRLLRMILDTAVDEDKIITTNPCKIKRAGIEIETQLTCPSTDTVAAIADAINPRWRAMVLVSALCSLRFGECAGLQRRHVDLQRRKIRVEHQGQQVPGMGFQLVGRKSKGEPYDVTIPKLLLPALEDHLATYVAAEPEAFVFTSVRGCPLRRPNFTKPWHEALARAGVGEWRFHDLRHHAGTATGQAGGNAKDIMARLGLKSERTAMRYLHTDDERGEEIAHEIDRRLEGFEF